MRRRTSIAVGWAVAVLAVGPFFGLWLASGNSGSAINGQDSPSPSASASHAKKVLAYPRVDKPCQGKVPEPFTGIATSGDVAANVASFHHSTGAHLHIIEFYDPFPGPFQRAEADEATALHALPLMQLNPRRISMAELAAGDYDGDIKAYAEQVREFGCKVAISFGHEMNGWWYPWGLPDTTPKVFKAAWRHLHDVFSEEHVHNVIWSWDPTHQYSKSKSGKRAYPAAMWFPGNKYVNWIGFDGYLGAGQTFNDVFGYQLKNLRRLTRKPIYLAETGVGDGPAAPKQVANLFAGIVHWHLAGLVWFDLNRKNSWSVEGEPAKDRAFRRALRRIEKSA
jgi:mannan endo-1,4-beta-mannosidase